VALYCEPFLMLHVSSKYQMYQMIFLLQSSNDRTTKCINNFRLLAEMKINRNKLYVSDWCSRIDLRFINRTLLEGEEILENSTVSACQNLM